jgi:hypothetical protein
MNGNDGNGNHGKGEISQDGQHFVLPPVSVVHDEHHFYAHPTCYAVR